MAAYKNNIIIDLAKVLGIFLMIFNHCSPDWFLKYFIAQFHMPLFFIISGYLFHQKSIQENLKKILWGLFIPYLLYQILYLPFKLGLLVLYKDLDFTGSLIRCIHGIIVGNNMENCFYTTVMSPAWFIMVIIELRLIFTFFKDLNYKNISIIGFLGYVLMVICYKNNLFPYFCLSSLFMALPYFCFGLIAAKKQLLENTSKINVYSLTKFCILIITALLFLQNFNGVIAMSEPYRTAFGEGSPEIMLLYAAGIFGSTGIFLTSSLINKSNKFIDTISKNTLFIMFFHWVLLFFVNWSGVRKIIAAIPNLAIQFVCVFFISAMIFAINYFAILICQKYCPVLLGKYRPE